MKPSILYKNEDFAEERNIAIFLVLAFRVGYTNGPK